MKLNALAGLGMPGFIAFSYWTKQVYDIQGSGYGVRDFCDVLQDVMELSDDEMLSLVQAVTEELQRREDDE